MEILSILLILFPTIVLITINFKKNFRDINPLISFYRVLYCVYCFFCYSMVYCQLYMWRTNIVDNICLFYH